MHSNKKIFCYSDLHIGLDASAIEAWFQTIENGLRWCNEAWLLGDLFDATWFDGDLKQLVKLAKWTLQLWDDINPKCIKHLVWGNHEKPKDQPHGPNKWDAFRAEIEKFIEDRGLNYKVHHNGYVYDGGVAGVHGHEGTLYEEWIPNQSEAKAFHYKILQRVMPGKLGHWVVFNVDESIRRIGKWLSENLLPSEKKGITDVIFGHVHNQFLEKQENIPELEKVITFRNTGCAIDKRPDQFNPLCFEIIDGKATNFRRAKQMFKEHQAVRRKEEAAISAEESLHI